MTTKELVNWMNSAIELRESTWLPKEKKYAKNNETCLQELKPNDCHDFEEDIARSLIGLGNDIRDWAKEAKSLG